MSSPSPDELARDLGAIERRGLVAAAESAAAADAGTTRAYDLASVIRTAMRETARLAQLERALSAGAPSAATRLRVMGDVAALSLAKVAIDGTAQAMVTDPGREDR